MTIPEAIKWYEAKLEVNKRVGLLGPQNEAAKLALAALREKEYFSETPPFPELTRGEVATEYLSICDEHDCAGDQSIGVRPCRFYEGPEVDDSGTPLPSRCKLKVILEEAQE